MDRLAGDYGGPKPSRQLAQGSPLHEGGPRALWGIPFVSCSWSQNQLPGLCPKTSAPGTQNCASSQPLVWLPQASDPGWWSYRLARTATGRVEMGVSSWKVCYLPSVRWWDELYLEKELTPIHSLIWFIHSTNVYWMFAIYHSCFRMLLDNCSDKVPGLMELPF